LLKDIRPEGRRFPQYVVTAGTGSRTRSLPDEIVQILNREINRALADRTFSKSTWARIDARASTRSRCTTHGGGRRKWRDVIEKAGIRSNSAIGVSDRFAIKPGADHGKTASGEWNGGPAAVEDRDRDLWHTRALKGRRAIEGVDPHSSRCADHRRLSAHGARREFDICEMAPTTYMIARALGAPFIALPVFLMRRFITAASWSAPMRHQGAEGPRGQKVGVRAYSSPPASGRAAFSSTNMA